ncbi:ABC transporter ATP-binding protein [bacterium]|nr:ABC transporter ATP-binding protein [bacterium]MCB2179087.1 ABC transporter ATP-binding protein [bacterium]
MEKQRSEKIKYAIKVENVTKRIENHVVLADVNLAVPVGACVGILGHNGAGKSMLLRVISGLVFPSSGEVRIFNEILGKDIEFPRNFGALIEVPGLLPQHSGYDNLHMLSQIRNLVSKEDIHDIIRLVGLDPLDKRPTKKYSTGMKQRLGIAIAIMENPSLLLLDEPTSGLDPQGVEDIHLLLQECNQRGVTILLTSHNREEVNLLCDMAHEMNLGRLTQMN